MARPASCRPMRSPRSPRPRCRSRGTPTNSRRHSPTSRWSDGRSLLLLIGARWKAVWHQRQQDYVDDSIALGPVEAPRCRPVQPDLAEVARVEDLDDPGRFLARDDATAGEHLSRAADRLTELLDRPIEGQWQVGHVRVPERRHVTLGHEYELILGALVGTRRSFPGTLVEHRLGISQGAGQGIQS